MRAFVRAIPLRPFLSALAIGGLTLSLAAPALEAQGAGTQTVTVRTGDDQEAEQVRVEFMRTLARYPPALGVLLKLDPTLMTRADYLAPYPALAAFIAKHPDIQRNSSYYLEQVRSSSNAYYYDPRQRAWENMLEMFGVFVIIVTMLGTLGWIIRTSVDYRRWGRLAKVQAEAHTKLLDRFTGNEELLAYVKSPAGARFLQSAPISLDGGARAMGAPLSRILWSMNAGVVLTAAGIGMNYVSRRIDPDMVDPIFTISVMLLSVGIGFLVSAGLSFMLSKRLGLLSQEQRDSVEV